MGIFNKEENWWLRLTIVLIALGSLGGFSMMNRGFITERKILTDSLNYYKLQIETLNNRVDSLHDENFIKSVDIGRDELTWEYVKEKFPSVYNNAMNYKSHETE
jgi:hypothetical protein